MWRRTPRAIIFDLDGCVWYPEMYHLWGGGGAPFKAGPEGDVTDRQGTRVRMLGNLRGVLREIHQDERWRKTVVGVASCTDEPEWARECLEKLQVCEGLRMGDMLEQRAVQIYKGSKKTHLRKIADNLGCSPEDIVFFDNERHNLSVVQPLGVTCVYTPEGMDERSWRLAAENFPSPGRIVE
eukprot:Hpha_TRINITY_DN27850_c0_g1::TRINITY_DN27850_c0_g1_i1::g.194000::m.194000/K17619/MDP1; magnesium-dependent phosphatase 1